METSQAPQDLVCSICWPCKTFKLKHHLRNHQRTVHSLQVVVPGHYKCLEDSCHQTFRYVEQLREHLNHSHAQFQGKFYVQELRFASFDDFEEWKKQEEERSIVRYIKSNSGSKITRSGMQHKYYVCSRSGKVRLTGKGIRKLKRQGSSKLNTRCTASIKADIHPSGLVTVKYCREHYGHEQGIKNIGHVGLSQNDRNWLANQILEGVPLDTILLKIQEGRGRPNSERLLMTTKTDLRNIRRQYGFHLPINKLFTCLEPGCNLTMENIRGAREKLRNHLEQQHNCIFDIHKETFSSDEEFEVWKSRLEAEAGIIFVRGSIRNFKSGRTRTYYRCSMSGIQKTKGNNHTVCTAEMIVVREMSGAQSVTYCLDHYGHQLNNTEVLTAVQNISDNQHSLILDTINSQTATVTIGRRNEEAVIIDPSNLACEESIVIDGQHMLNTQSSNNGGIHLFSEPVVVSQQSLLSSPQPPMDGHKMMQVVHPLVHSTHMDSPPSQLIQIIPLPSDVKLENIDGINKKSQINATNTDKINVTMNESYKNPKTELGLWISSVLLPAVESCNDRQRTALVKHRLEEALELLQSKQRQPITSPITMVTRPNSINQKENKEQIFTTFGIREEKASLKNIDTAVGQKVTLFQHKDSSTIQKITVFGENVDITSKSVTRVENCSSDNISAGRVLVQMEAVSGSKGKVMLGRAITKNHQNGPTPLNNYAPQNTSKKRQNELPCNALYKKRLKQSEERLFLPDQESLSKFSPDGTDEIVNSIFISEVDDAMRPQYKRMEPNYESVIKIKKVVTKPIENSIHRNLDNFEFMGKSKNFQLNSEGIRVAREEVVASVDSFL